MEIKNFEILNFLKFRSWIGGYVPPFPGWRADRQDRPTCQDVPSPATHYQRHTLVQSKYRDLGIGV